MWEKLKSIFLFNGFEPDVMRNIRGDLVKATNEGLSKLSIGLAMLYAASLPFARSNAYLQVDLLYLAAIAVFQSCLYMYKKTKNIHIVELAIVVFILSMLGISAYDSTALCLNSVGTFFPIYLLLFAVMFTGNPLAIDVIMLLMTVVFLLMSRSAKPWTYFRKDMFTTGFVLLIANMVNAMSSRSRISAILKTAEVEQNRKKYAAMAENYQTLYNNVPCAIMEIRCRPGKRHVSEINSRGLALYGETKQDYEEDGIELTEWAHPDDRPILNEAFSKLTKVGDKAGYEYRLRRKDGSYTWVVGQALVRTAGTTGQTVLAACVDIDAEKKAIDANEAKSKFLSRMSHDIRTPMNAIIGLTDIVLESDALAADERKNLESVKLSSTFLLGLINDILDVSKIEANEMELHKEPYFIQEFLTYLNTMIRPLCDKKGVEFLIRNENKDCPYILTDKVRFNQIFFNLLSNAVKFTPSGGRVEMEIAPGVRRGNTIEEVITVSDTGIGMSEAFQKRMFDPFSQESGQHINESEGSGLGLAIVKQIVDLMGGTIKVQSKKGEGTRYDISLSLELCDAVEETKKEIDLGSLQGKRVLLCEDQIVNRQIAERLLRKVGMAVESAENGQLGLEKFEVSAPGYYDAILMDIRMPILGGLEATRLIRASNHPDAKAVPIIAMTANAFESDRELSLAAGMNEHIIKPVDREALYGTLARFCGKAG